MKGKKKQCFETSLIVNPQHADTDTYTINDFMYSIASCVLLSSHEYGSLVMAKSKMA